MMTTFDFTDADFTLTEDRLKTLFWLGELIPGGLFIYRAEEPLELLYANRNTLRIFGCDTLEQFKALTGFTFRGLVHPEDFEDIQSSIDRQIAESTEERLDFVEYRVVRRDGEVRWISDFGRLAHIPGYGDVYIVFITDSTERRRAQEKQTKIEMELAHERQINEFKSSFLFNMSHDIRTPMNAIIGFSELARRHRGEPELLEGYLDKTVASGRQLLCLIDDILELNTLENAAAALHPEPTDLRAQLELELDQFRIPAAQKNVALVEQLDLPAEEVLVDQDRFRRILSNLLSNAVKFTPAGGQVTVSARQLARSDSGFVRCEFQVADTGVGISEAYLDKIFDSFERETSSTVSGTVGTGLGLTIVKTLLNLMGGSVSVRSEKGKGSVFTVELPLQLAGAVSAEPADAGCPACEETPEEQFRILVVEDIEFNRMLAETLLEEAGFLVESVPDGCDAVEAVKSRPADYYDLILMDIQMPVMNGYEATRAIRALPREDVGRLPILALSANAREEDRRRSMESGMDNHVAKPFDIDFLVGMIHKYIRVRRESGRGPVVM